MKYQTRGLHVTDAIQAAISSGTQIQQIPHQDSAPKGIISSFERASGEGNQSNAGPKNMSSVLGIGSYGLVVQIPDYGSKRHSGIIFTTTTNPVSLLSSMRPIYL